MDTHSLGEGPTGWKLCHCLGQLLPTHPLRQRSSHMVQSWVWVPEIDRIDLNGCMVAWTSIWWQWQERTTEVVKLGEGLFLSIYRSHHLHRAEH